MPSSSLEDHWGSWGIGWHTYCMTFFEGFLFLKPMSSHWRRSQTHYLLEVVYVCSGLGIPCDILYCPYTSKSLSWGISAILWGSLLSEDTRWGMSYWEDFLFYFFTQTRNLLDGITSILAWEDFNFPEWAGQCCLVEKCLDFLFLNKSWINRRQWLAGLINYILELLMLAKHISLLSFMKQNST